MDNSLKNTLTISMKAAKLKCGFDPAKEAIENGTAAVVLVMADASPKTEKEIRFFADRKGVRVIKTGIPILEMQGAVGKKAAVLAVCDEGFAASILSKLGDPHVMEDSL
ncbi:MAG: ribosomal L7Ae/L30e/S12e/Gadd45 family protein [Oscillospiraceae bacterium]|nr:ribosomal L7Ae/L30e/S12e/Gadd45 family protein [Oscillospiraceae bacterium]